MVRQIPSEQNAVSPELRLDALDVLNPQLDYAHSVHSLYSKTSSAYGPARGRGPAMLRQAKTRPGWKPVRLSTHEGSLHAGTMVPWYMGVNQDDFDQALLHFDVLDLHRLAEGLYDTRVGNNDTEAPVLSAVERKNIADTLSLASLNDRMLKEAYKKLGDRVTPIPIKAKLWVVIQRLEKLPHLHRPTHREENDDIHVSRWLLNYTQNPEPEMVGFATSDPFEPRRFIADVKPRLSSSDTRVVLGKRKRAEMEEDEYEVGATDCGSDTLLVERRDCVRPLGAKRRRASRQGVGE